MVKAYYYQQSVLIVWGMGGVGAATDPNEGLSFEIQFERNIDMWIQ